MEQDEVYERFLQQVAADYTNEEYLGLVRAFHRPWEDRLLRDPEGTRFLMLWRQLFTYNEEIVFDGLAAVIESQQRQ